MRVSERRRAGERGGREGGRERKMLWKIQKHQMTQWVREGTCESRPKLFYF